MSDTVTLSHFDILLGERWAASSIWALANVQMNKAQLVHSESSDCEFVGSREQDDPGNSRATTRAIFHRGRRPNGKDRADLPIASDCEVGLSVW